MKDLLGPSRRLFALCFVSACLAPRVGHGDDAAELAELKASLREVKRENEQLRRLLADHGIEVGNGYQSIMEILDELPAELKAAKAWDADEVDAVRKWLSEHPVGRAFQSTLQVERVNVIRRPAGASNASNQYLISVSFQSRDYKFRGLAFTQEVGAGWPQPLKFDGDKQLAGKFERLKPGQRILVKGKVHSIYLGPESSNRRKVHIGLAEFDVKLPGE